MKWPHLVEPAKTEAVNIMGELMQEAMSLGALRIYQYTDLHGQRHDDFEAKIVLLSGRSKVEAIGRQSNLCAALAEAIQEARRLSR